VQFVADVQLTFVAELFPNFTFVPPAAVLKLSPVIVSDVPPVVGPLVGLIAVMTGGPHAGNLKEAIRVCQPRSLVAK
jgi:hypothetical protein